MDKFKSSVEKLQVNVGNITSLSIILLVIVTLYGTITRYVFKNASDWTYEVSIFIFGIYSMLSGGYVLKEKEHVSVDIIYNILSDKGINRIKFLGSIMAIIMSTAMIGWGTRSAWQSTVIRERSIHQSSFNPEVWWFKWFIPLAGLLVLLQAISDLHDNYKLLKGGD